MGNNVSQEPREGSRGGSWYDKPQNYDRWERLQNSNAFLKEQQDRGGGPQVPLLRLRPLEVVHWSDTANQNNPMKATVDHVIPVSRGGRDEPSNMVVSCAPCNYRKKDT